MYAYMYMNIHMDVYVDKLRCVLSCRHDHCFFPSHQRSILLVCLLVISVSTVTDCVCEKERWMQKIGVGNKVEGGDFVVLIIFLMFALLHNTPGEFHIYMWIPEKIRMKNIGLQQNITLTQNTIS